MSSAINLDFQIWGELRIHKFQDEHDHNVAIEHQLRGGVKNTLYVFLSCGGGATWLIDAHKVIVLQKYKYMVGCSTRIILDNKTAPM